MYRPTQSDSAPIWQAYVEAGTTKDERNRRLDAAPEGMRERIRGHVMTAWLHQNQRDKPVKRETNRAAEKTSRRVNRGNPY